MICIPIPENVLEWGAAFGAALAGVIWSWRQHYQHKDHNQKIAELEAQLAILKKGTEEKKQT